MSELSSAFFQHVAQTSDDSIALEVERAEGVYLYSPEGKAYMDFISGICVSNVGHGAPEIISAIQAQSERYLHPIVYGEGIMSPQVQYAKALAQVLGPDLEVVYFTNSGAEAIEGAMKVAKKYTGRTEIVAFQDAYHGSTHGAMSVSGDPRAKEGYGPLLPNIRHLRFNEWSDLEAITSKTAACIIEPIQGAGGIILPQSGYLQAVRERCTETGTLFVLDEIQTGFGRTGALFAHQAYEITPDILVLAKALGGGLPLGAFISRPEIIDVIRRKPPLGFITTFGGHPVSCAAGHALLKKIQDDQLLATIPEKEQLLLEKLIHPAIQELRGKGLMYAMILEDRPKAEQVRQRALQNGLITIGFLSIDHGLRLCPPLTISTAELLLGIEILLASLSETT